MINSYESMAFQNKAFKKMVEIMENQIDIPFVQHCKSGKDRTGIGSALILLMLGVPMDKVREDYLASNGYRKEYNEMVKAKFAALLTDEKSKKILSFMTEVKSEYFDAIFEFIAKKYPTLEKYFEKEYGLTDERVSELKEEYLY